VEAFGPLGKVLVLVGVVLVLLGGCFLLVPHVPFLGRLPGDVHFERKGVTVIFPLVTCLIVSGVLTLLVNLFFRR
jgi:hypothetical protein